jgi:rSAM/selenodomain-associated transferase 2
MDKMQTTLYVPLERSSVALSVVIPTLNEAAQLPSLLAQLSRQRAIHLEVIVADGGSRDTSRQIAAEFQAKVVVSPPGRGRQMNLGAAQASAPLLLFLHADSSFSAEDQLSVALDALQQAWRRAGHQRVAGHFRLHFQRSQPGNALAYRYYEAKTALNRPECTNGDQGMLLARDFFHTLGGFDTSLGFLEDQRLAERIRQQGQWITLPGMLETSARRFEREGLARRMLLSALIMNCNAIGWDAFFQRTASLYRQQAHTDKLQLSPIFALIDALNRAASPPIRRQRWLATGRYVQAHLWQACFFLDVLMESKLGIRRRGFLACHDRLLQPLQRFRPLNYLITGVVWLGYRLVRSWMRYRER